MPVLLTQTTQVAANEPVAVLRYNGLVTNSSAQDHNTDKVFFSRHHFSEERLNQFEPGTHVILLGSGKKRGKLIGVGHLVGAPVTAVHSRAELEKHLSPQGVNQRVDRETTRFDICITSCIVKDVRNTPLWNNFKCYQFPTVAPAIKCIH